MKMNNFNPPKTTEISYLFVSKSWLETEKHFQDVIPEQIERLSKYMGRLIWLDGYRVNSAEFRKECEQYDSLINSGIFCDVEMEMTYAQRFYPLFNAYRDAVGEIMQIKETWWYRLLRLFGLIKTYKPKHELD